MRTLNEIRNSATNAQEHIDLLEVEVEQLRKENEQIVAAWNGHKAVVGSLMQTLEQLRAEKTELIEALEIARSALMKGTAYKTGEVMVIDGALAKARGGRR